VSAVPIVTWRNSAGEPPLSQISTVGCVLLVALVVFGIGAGILWLCGIKVVEPPGGEKPKDQ
jgi:hypothetical protein